MNTLPHMDPIKTARLFLAFVLLSFGLNAGAQALHFKDILGLYPLDSNSFKAFCAGNNYDVERNAKSKSGFTITFQSSKDDKRMLSQSYMIDTSARAVLNYSLRDQQEYDAMLKEIKEKGFTFKRHQFTTIQNYNIDKAIYEKAPDIAALYTETREDAEAPFSYFLGVSRVLYSNNSTSGDK